MVDPSRTHARGMIGSPVRTNSGSSGASYVGDTRGLGFRMPVIGDPFRTNFRVDNEGRDLPVSSGRGGTKGRLPLEKMGDPFRTRSDGGFGYQKEGIHDGGD